MTAALRFAAAAATLAGCRFRLHGRDPETGLDCVGVVVAALHASGHACDLPTGYRLRTGRWPDADDWALRNGFAPATGSTRSGDVLLGTPGPNQLHMMVVAPDPAHVIEAHAGLRKVVLSPLPAPSAILQAWRLCAAS